MTFVPTRTMPQPALNESSFQELLAAAYVVQQHNDALRNLGSVPAVDEVAFRNLDLPSAKKVETGLTGDCVANDCDSGTVELLPPCCRVCGRSFGADEAFCGNCSMPRLAATGPENLQSKWASLWYMQQARQATDRDRPGYLEDEIEKRQPDTPQSSSDHPLILTQATEDLNRSKPIQDSGSLWTRSGDASGQGNADSSNAGSNCSSEEAPELLQSTWQTVWGLLRGRYLAFTVGATGLLLLFLVMIIWPSANNPQLTWFQSLLVELGIAGVPPHPAPTRGNPDAKVWVDVHTGLYYCAGSDLYGKTAGGYVATQHDAQLDQFEAGDRAPCP